MWRSAFTWIALLAASALVVVLGLQNRGLREDRDRLTDRAAYAYAGMYVPVVDAPRIDGGRLALGAPAGDLQVVFFFDETCPYCLRSAPTVVDVATTLQREFGERAAMIGVCQCSPEQARAYTRAHGFTFPVVTVNAQRALALYRARGVPMLLAIDREGRVRHAVQGVFDTREQAEGLLAELRRMQSPARLASNPATRSGP
jgi:peroxiredoxin